MWGLVSRFCWFGAMGVLFLFVSGCASHSYVGKHRYVAAEVQSRARAAIASSEPAVGRAAVRILSEGGNLADAAVAASFALSVARPQSTGLGGGGFLVYYNRATKKTEAWDFRETAPSAATADMYLVNGAFVPEMPLNGAKAVAVPGLVAGLYAFHKKHGRLSWAKVLEPAIEFAESGVVVSEHFVRSVATRGDVLLKDPEMKRIFTREGQPFAPGDVLKQADLAKTLRGIAAQGKKYFYEGEFAKALVKWMKESGGLVTKKDLANYRVKIRKPLISNWREWKIASMPPPSSGGIHLLQILSMVDQVSDEFKRSFSEVTDDGESIGLRVAEIEAFRRAFIDRSYYLGDPDFYKVPQADLLAPAYLANRAREIEKGRVASAKEILPWGIESKTKQTSHLSLMDSEGNAISTTQTINYLFGAAVMAPGTGVVLNDEMDDFSAKPGAANVFGLVGGAANKIQPGKRPVSSMTPTIVLDSKGYPKMVIGAPGGSKIITEVYEVLSRILRDHESAEKAVAACRFHHQWAPDKLMLEGPCFEKYKVLEKYYALERMAPPGEVQVVGIDEQNQMYSAVDPRGVQAQPVVWSGGGDLR